MRGQTMSIDPVRPRGESPPDRLPPVRLREIRDRIRRGFYDTARVQNRVAERAQDELAKTAAHEGPGPPLL